MATVGNITPDSPEYHDLVESCKAMGICWACRAPVLDGEPRYGVTQAHYDCQKPFLPTYTTKEDFKAAVDRVDAAFDRAHKAIDELLGTEKRRNRPFP